jgi:hypothetical protein
MMMFQWRVTKYDPRRRNRQGHFLDDDWTAASDIGNAFGSEVLTLETYLAVENQYVGAAMRFLAESGLDTLTVTDMEGEGRLDPDDDPAGGASLDTGFAIHEGQQISGAELEQAIRLNLRSLVWCTLEEPGRFFIHFGYDYYMYIGSWAPCLDSIAYASQLGLFVEPFTSPY